MRPAGAAEGVQMKTIKVLGQSEIQSSRWDELCLCDSDPQLKQISLRVNLLDMIADPKG
jgi:hypothetical protein